MKSTLIVLFSLVSLAAHAQVSRSEMSCMVTNPCKYSKPNNLGYCVGETRVVFGDRSLGNYVLVTKKTGVLDEVLRVAAIIPVSKSGLTISGMSEDGENIFDLQGKQGRLTLEQDFEFSVKCQ